MSEPDNEREFRDGLCGLLPRMRRFARTLAGNVHDADDLVQVAVERALARADQWQPGRPLESWVFGIVRNAWIDETRTRGRWRQVLASEAEGQAVGDAAVERHGVLLSVEAAMARLPEEQRTAVALVLIEGLSYREASEALDVPIGTLTSRLARGRETLQELLDESSEAVR